MTLFARKDQDAMEDEFEQEIRYLTIEFRANVQRVLSRKAESVFRQALDLSDDPPPSDPPSSNPPPSNASPIAPPPSAPSARSHSAADYSSGKVPLPSPNTSTLRRLTTDELIAVRARLMALICEQPGQRVDELARIVGLPATRVRRQLRQLVEEGAIEVEERLSGRKGFPYHTFRAIEPLAATLSLVAEASG